jgi:PAS domain S-box-containing protein
MDYFSSRLASFDKLLFDEVGMIGLDTVGNRLGHVICCNSQIKHTLGYERDSLIGKNITHIMPKIYSDLHNNLLLNYLHKKDETLST